jgi:hypothetical protein
MYGYEIHDEKGTGRGDFVGESINGEEPRLVVCFVVSVSQTLLGMKFAQRARLALLEAVLGSYLGMK